jgi:NAD(P)H-flavin reductase
VKGAFRGESGGCPAGDIPVIITEDGSLGEKGLVTDFLVPARYAAVFACGPLPMLRAVYQKCAVNGVPCYVSMETRMACGVGACLGCRINTKQGNRRCCKDGPVFDAGNIEW